MSKENKLIPVNEKMQMSFTSKASRFLNLFLKSTCQRVFKATKRGVDFSFVIVKVV